MLILLLVACELNRNALIVLGGRIYLVDSLSVISQDVRMELRPLEPALCVPVTMQVSKYAPMEVHIPLM